MLQVFQSFATVPIVAVVALLALVLIARPDRGPGDDGLYAAYLSAIGVASLYLLLTAGAAALDAIAQGVLVSFPAPGSGFEGVTPSSSGFLSAIGGFGGPESSDTAAITAVVNGVLAIAAGLVLVFHLRRRQELRASDAFAGSAADRVDRAFLAGVCFLTATIGVAAASITGYSIMRLVAPDVTGTLRQFEEEQGTAQLIAYGLLTVISFTVFRFCFWSIRGAPDNSDDDEGVDVGMGDDELIEPS